MLGKYEGESNENFKYFFISLFTEHKRYTMSSFFYVVPIAFHTSSVLRRDFPSRRLQPLQCPLVSLLGVPDQVEDNRINAIHELPIPLVHLL